MAMYRSGLSLASSRSSRGTGGAMKTTNLPSYSSSRPVAGNTTSSSSYTSMRTSKPLHSSSGRSLPNGPGPTLPNRPTFDDGRLKFIASHSGTSTSREGERTSHVSSGKDNAYPNNNYRYGSLVGRKSKPIKELYSRDETIDSSPYYRTRTESFSTSNRGVSDKMGSHHSSQGSTERDYMSSKPYANTNTRQSLYQSTTHSDYRDPKADDSTRTSLTKPAYSRTLDRDLPIGYGNENNVNIIDVEKTRKASITASPADLKCLRRSSSSSNNSSPWVSTLPWPVLG